MFNLIEMLQSLTGGQNPDQAVLNSNGAMPQSAPPPQTALPPVPSTPQGVKTPVTNPVPPTSSPAIYQSPGDLSNMYATLMARNQNAQQLDSGLTLMAAGLSPNLSTRQALISAAGGGAGKGVTAQDLINIQKQEQANMDLKTRRAMLGGLMKQYKLTEAQANYLEASGKLDEVIKHYSTENLAQATDANGQIHFVAPRTGQIITTIGTEKPEETTTVKTPQGDQLVSKVTGLPVGPAHGNTETNVDAKGTKFPALDTGFDYERDDKGFVKVGENGMPKAIPTPGSKAEAEIVEKQQKKVERKIEAASAVASVGTAIDAASKAMDEAIIPGAVGPGSKLYNVTVGQLGGMAGNVIRDNIDTIKANASFQKLQAMRDASPTGGALGNVSDFENRLLSSAVATLSPNLQADQLRENMFRVKATMELLANKQYTDEKAFDADVKKRISDMKIERANKVPGRSGITVTRE